MKPSYIKNSISELQELGEVTPLRNNRVLVQEGKQKVIWHLVDASTDKSYFVRGRTARQRKGGQHA